MQTPIEIDFQGIDARLDIRAAITKHVAELEQRSGRVTACRVVLKDPGGHHRKGSLYEVNIRLALPDGREVNVNFDWSCICLAYRAQHLRRLLDHIIC